MASKFFRYIILFVLLVTGFQVKAQFGCVDTTFASPHSYCFPWFEPVCGCDGITYSNSCEATQKNGVLQYEGGPCEPVVFRYSPNPVTRFLNLEIVSQNIGTINFFIFNLYGKRKHYQLLNWTDRYQINLDISDYEYGLYFILIEKDEYYTIQKFAKSDP